MIKKAGFSTSETSGFTGLSVVTIQRYVRRYRRAFSPSASMSSKGRRFLDDDIKKLLFINRMIYEKKTGEIEAALDGDIDLTLFDVRQFITMYRNFSEMLKVIDGLFEDVKTEKKHSSSWSESLWAHMRHMENEVKKLDKKIWRVEAVRGLKRLGSSEADNVLDMFVEMLHTRQGKKYVAEAFDKFFEQKKDLL